MFLNKQRVILSKCFLILFVIVFSLFVRVNAEDKNNTLVKVLKNILPKSSLSEDTNKESIAFNPVIHDQLGTIFKKNNRRRGTKEYTTNNTSDESLREQDNQEKINPQNSTHQEKLTRVKNARTNAYGTSYKEVELDNLIDPSSKKEIPKTSKIVIRNDPETFKTAKSEKNASIQGINGEKIPLRSPNEGNQRLLNNQTLEDTGKDREQPLVDTGTAEIDEKADRLNLKDEIKPVKQLKADKIGLDLEKDQGYPNKTVRQDNQPNRQSKDAKNEVDGLVKSDESCLSDYGVLFCETKFTLNSTVQTITSWQLSCSYFIKDRARISISLINASDNSYKLELRTPKSDFKTERKEDNLAPFCDDSYSVCIYFDNSFISQPKIVTLHPYLVFEDPLEKTLQLGTLDLYLDENLKKKHFHHDFKQHTHDSINHWKEHHDWKQNQHSDHHHHFGKLEIGSKYDHHKPLVQFWNPSESGGDNFGHYHHNHNDDAQYSSSHQSNVYHHSNDPLFTSNHGKAPLLTRGNLGNGYDSNLHSDVVQNHPESYHRDNNAFDEHYRGNGASYSYGSHGNDMNYYSGNQGTHQYIKKFPQYSPSYRKINAYNSRHHGNVEQSSSGNYDNDRKKMSDNGWEPIISP